MLYFFPLQYLYILITSREFNFNTRLNNSLNQQTSLALLVNVILNPQKLLGNGVAFELKYSMTYVKCRNKYTSRKLQENNLNIYIRKCHLMLLVALARVYCPYVLVTLKLISSEKNILSAMTKIF